MIRIRSRKRIAKVAFNTRPRTTSYGGGNQWLVQMIHDLKRANYEVCFKLEKDIDCIVTTHAGLSGELSFSFQEINDFKLTHSHVPCIHRINDNDQRKKTADMDGILSQSNRMADHTVFISDWLRGYHTDRWFDEAKPHSVIYNGGDPRIFHPVGSATWPGKGMIRVVTHHWSDNPLKGFDVYQEIDNAVANGELEGFEFWVIGRWPADIQWKAARTFPPANGHRLAGMLRQCHLYVTATRWEPGGMHHVEGAQCGLPLAYHEDGGGVIEMGKKYGIGFRDGVVDALKELRRDYTRCRRLVLENAPNGDSMCLDYRRLVQNSIVAGRNHAR